MDTRFSLVPAGTSLGILDRPTEGRSRDRWDQAVASAEIAHARRQAADVLGSLLQAREQLERKLTETGRSDAIRTITGRSSLDEAIESTRDMLAALDRIARA
jgi:hypothetical protein